MTSAQLPLLIPTTPAYDEASFHEASSNETARTWLGRTEVWPEHRLALWGGADHGKTHLARIWATRHDALFLDGPRLSGLPDIASFAGVTVDDADRADETALLHLLNTARDQGRPILLAGRAAPARWPVALPDLASRLRAITAVEVEAPDDELLRLLLLRWLAQRGLVADAALHHRLLLRLPRSASVLRAAVERLDLDALTSRVRKVTPAMVSAALAAGAPNDDSEKLPESNSSGPSPVTV